MSKRMIIITLPANKFASEKNPNFARHEATEIKLEDSVVVESMEFDHVESVPNLASDESSMVRPLTRSNIFDLNWERDKAPEAPYTAAFVRKRQRLAHLTPDEKLKRRKHKNRAAAHLARERRKSFSDDLERTYRRLRYENDGLKSRNKQIKYDIERLSFENKELQQRLEFSESPQVLKDPQNTFGSAAFISEPQQKVRALVGLTFSWLMTLLVSSTSTSSACSENSSPDMQRQTTKVDRKWQKIMAQIESMPLHPDSRNSMIAKLEKLKIQLTSSLKEFA